jgi:hypothetical protein
VISFSALSILKVREDLASLRPPLYVSYLSILHSKLTKPNCNLPLPSLYLAQVTSVLQTDPFHKKQIRVVPILLLRTSV